MKKHDDEIAIKREQIQANMAIAGLKEDGTTSRFLMDHDRVNMESLEKARIDSDKNGIDDYLDVRRTEVDENYKQEQIRIADAKLVETQRANKAKEDLARLNIQANKNKTNK